MFMKTQKHFPIELSKKTYLLVTSSKQNESDTHVDIYSIFNFVLPYLGTNIYS